MAFADSNFTSRQNVRKFVQCSTQAAHYMRWLEQRERPGLHLAAYKRSPGHATNMDRTLFLFKNACFMNVSGCKFNRFVIFKKDMRRTRTGRFSSSRTTAS